METLCFLFCLKWTFKPRVISMSVYTYFALSAIAAVESRKENEGLGRSTKMFINIYV